MSEKLYVNLTRAQLSKITTDARVIRALELILTQVNGLSIEDIITALAAISALGDMSSQMADNVAITGGDITANLKNNQTNLLESTVTLTNGAAAAAGTLSNAPVAGNPTKWVAINDNGTLRYVPAW